MKKFAGFDIKNLADEFGTPIYIYSKSLITENFFRLKQAFQNYYPNTKIHFSVKSNSNPYILKIFEELGAGVDCSSPNEVRLVSSVGFSGEKIVYTGNYESQEDLKTAFESGAKINLDDITSLSRLLKVAFPERISFRINPGIGRGGFEGITTAGADAKFGVPYEMAYEAYKEAYDAGIKRFGIHMMTGSNNLEPYYFAEVVDKLLTIAGNTFSRLGIRPEYIDIGGGFGHPYADGEEPLNIELTAKLISDVFIDKCKKYDFGEPELILEPGRYLIAGAGILITKITGIKNSYKKFVGLNAGMSTLIRPALYGARHKITVYGKTKNVQIVNVCGPICENSDIFSNNLPFPIVAEGDIAVIHDTGAYGFVMSSNYNGRLRPAEILLSEKKAFIIRVSETL